MSIDNELLRIKNAKTAIRNAVNAKGGKLTDTQLIDDYAAAVTALPTGEGVELSFVTATASDILSGKVGADIDGQPVYGNIQTVTASLTDNAVTVPAGHIATAQTLTVANADAPSVSGNAVTVYKGYQAEQTTVEVAKATATLDKNTVTIPAGYHEENTLTVPEADIIEGRSEGDVTTKRTINISPGYVPEEKSWTFYETDISSGTVTADTMLEGVIGYGANGRVVGTITNAAAPTVDGNTVTIYPGYVAEEVTIKTAAGSSTASMDFYKCAAVYGPRDVTCFIISGCPVEAANGTYLPTEYTTEDWEGNKQPVYSNGTYYYYYEPNNWMSWGVGADYTGDLLYSGSGTSWSDSNWETVEGMSSAESTTTVDLDVPKTWDGHKVVFDGEYYSFDKTLTTGLVWDEIKPVPLLFYSEDALIQIKSFYNNLPYPVFWAPLTAAKSKAETGQFFDGSPAGYTVVDGIPCCKTGGSKHITFRDEKLPAGTSQRTLSCRFRVDESTALNDNCVLFGYGTGSTIRCFRLMVTPSFGITVFGWDADITTAENVWQKGKWYHLAATKNGTAEKIYLNGKLIKEGETNKNTSVSGSYYGVIGGGYSTQSFTGYLSDCRIYDVELSSEEIAQLANEFTPTA